MKQTGTRAGSAKKLQPLTAEQLKLIEEMAGVCFTPEEIAIASGIEWLDAKAAFKDKKSDFYKAYKKGALLYMLQVRKSIYELAKGGSSASQAEFLKMRKDADSFISKNNL